MTVVDALPIRHNYTPTRQVYGYVFESGSTDAIPFLPELDRMLTLENANGYHFQASPKAHSHAKAYLEVAYAIASLCDARLPRPRFMPDGESGIDIEWEKGARNLTLSCRGLDHQQDFIYWEENGAYDGKDASLTLLMDKLDWLRDG